jgi:hypothetical protein
MPAARVRLGATEEGQMVADAAKFLLPLRD